MYIEYMEGERKDAVTYLIDKLGHLDGSDRFILGVRDGLGLSGGKLVWWMDIFDKYHNHDDYSYANILRTRRHFKNLAFSYLDENNYKMFNTWIKNWSNVLIICRHAYPEKWSIKNFEDIK